MKLVFSFFVYKMYRKSFNVLQLSFGESTGHIQLYASRNLWGMESWLIQNPLLTKLASQSCLICTYFARYVTASQYMHYKKYLAAFFPKLQVKNDWNDAVTFFFPKGELEFFHAHYREYIEEIEQQHNHISIIRKDYNSFRAIFHSGCNMQYNTFICLFYIRVQLISYRHLLTVYFYTVLQTIASVTQALITTLR